MEFDCATPVMLLAWAAVLLISDIPRPTSQCLLYSSPSGLFVVSASCICAWRRCLTARSVRSFSSSLSSRLRHHQPAAEGPPSRWSACLCWCSSSSPLLTLHPSEARLSSSLVPVRHRPSSGEESEPCHGTSGGWASAGTRSSMAGDGAAETRGVVDLSTLTQTTKMT